MLLIKLSKLILMLTLSGLLIIGCNQESGSASDSEAADENTAILEADEQEVDAGIVDVTTSDFKIHAPAKLKKGWTTFRFTNNGKQVHFVGMYRLVEGKTIDDQLRDVAPVFNPLMEGLRRGELTKADIGPFLQRNIPEWGLQMTWVGGAGLLAPGDKTESTFYIDQSGTYLLECYVKAPDGQWHTLMGMLHQVVVTDEMNDAVEPEAYHEVSVSNSGVDAPQTIPAGRQTFKISMLEQPEGFMPYDLNLARLDGSVSIDKIAHWMDWTNPGGFRAPAPVDFLGGLEHMDAGNHGYVMVDLEPGEYIWISEVNAGTVNKTFVVK
ncbi:hypothetical protein [Kangiella shandongensis]|uniref:hypothetical protein n=1 Tax=Kangiella shandongensis TaxID=2763258 RepID=UPI001CBE9F93|nr:hypothetical protein [Kangiella shandongensis]